MIDSHCFSCNNIYMPITSTEKLFKLVKSLTKSEKRNFKLYANRNQGDGNLQFLKLFDALDKQSQLNEKVVKVKLGAMTTGAYSNLKRNLFDHVKVSTKIILSN